MDPAWSALRSLLRDALALRAEPVVIVGDITIPAASLWNGTRCWVSAFRAAGLVAGDRLTVLPRRHPALLQAVVASLWHGLDVAVAPGAMPTVAGGDDDGGAFVDLAAVPGLAGPRDALVAGWPCGHGPADRSGDRLARGTTPTPWLRMGDGHGGGLVADPAAILAVLQGAGDRYRDRVVLAGSPTVAATDLVAELLAPLTGGAAALVWPGVDPAPGDGALERLCSRYAVDIVLPRESSNAAHRTDQADAGSCRSLQA